MSEKLPSRPWLNLDPELEEKLKRETQMDNERETGWAVFALALWVGFFILLHYFL